MLQNAQADRAVALLEALDALRPGDIRTMLGLATAYLRIGAANRALQTLARTARNADRPPTCDLLRAQALAALGRTIEARDAMETFLLRQSHRPPAHPTRE